MSDVHAAVRAEHRRMIARIRDLADSRENPNDAQAQGCRWVAEFLRIEGPALPSRETDLTKEAE